MLSGCPCNEPSSSIVRSKVERSRPLLPTDMGSVVTIEMSGCWSDRRSRRWCRASFAESATEVHRHGQGSGRTWPSGALHGPWPSHGSVACGRSARRIQPPVQGFCGGPMPACIKLLRPAAGRAAASTEPARRPFPFSDVCSPVSNMDEEANRQPPESSGRKGKNECWCQEHRRGGKTYLPR